MIIQCKNHARMTPNPPRIFPGESKKHHCPGLAFSDKIPSQICSDPPQVPFHRSFSAKDLSTYTEREPDCIVFNFAQTRAESSPILSAWVTSLPHTFDWRDYVRYGCARNSDCDSGGCVACASRVKQVAAAHTL